MIDLMNTILASDCEVGRSSTLNPTNDLEV